MTLPVAYRERSVRMKGMGEYVTEATSRTAERYYSRSRPLRVPSGFWGMLIPLISGLDRRLRRPRLALQLRDRRGMALPSGRSATRRPGFASAVPGGCLHARRKVEVKS